MSVCLFSSPLIGYTDVCVQVEGRRRKEKPLKTSKGTDERLHELGLEHIGELVDLFIIPIGVSVIVFAAEALVSKAEAIKAGKLVATQAADDLQKAVGVAVELLGCLLGRGVDAHAAVNVDALDAFALAQHGHDWHCGRLGKGYNVHALEQAADPGARAAEKSQKRVGLLELESEVVQDELCSGEDLSNG